MNSDKEVEALNRLPGHDPESEHAKADEILLEFLRRSESGRKVAGAYCAARERIDFWYA